MVLDYRGGEHGFGLLRKRMGGWSNLFKPITPSDVKIGIGLN